MIVGCPFAFGWTPPAYALAIDGLCSALAGFVDRTETASVLEEITANWYKNLRKD